LLEQISHVAAGKDISIMSFGYDISQTADWISSFPVAGGR
jgi:hypothetical protein